MNLKKHLMLLVLFMFNITYLLAQQKTISGTVIDNSGLPLPGVNVIVKGTTTGIQTDFGGNYSINANAGDVLAFSYVGLKTEERTIGSANTINVTMEEDAESLEEIVVTALGIKTAKKALGYSVQEVKGETITQSRNTNALNSLSGKVAGVSISSNSSNIGGSSRILLRGIGSITQNNTPLIIVDGIPLDNSNFNSQGAQNGGGGRDFGDTASDIDPDTIESISVLKGGSAAALYGSRATNGAIVITTKGGKDGKAEITVNSGISFTNAAILPKIQTQYGGGSGDSSTIGQSTFSTAVINGTTYNIVDYATDESWGPRYDVNTLVLHWDAFDPEFAADYLNPRPWVHPKNDLNSFYNTGVSYDNSISFTQGNEKSTSRLSLKKTTTEGIVPGSKLNKISVGLKNQFNISNKFQVNGSINFTSTKANNRPIVGYDGGSLLQKFYQFGQSSLDYDRLKNYQLADGTQRTWNRTAFNNPVPRFSDNPYWIINNYLSEDKRTRWYGSIGGKYNISDNLYVTGNIYGDTYSFLTQETIAKGSADTASVIDATRTFVELNYESKLHFDKTFFDDKLSLTSFIGGNVRTVNRTRITGQSSGGLVVDGIFNLSNSVDKASVTNYLSNRRVNSVFASASFGYDNFLYFTAIARNDWSSTLPQDNNSYFYPSVNGSFIFSKFIDANWLSFGKIRGGWANVGNDANPYLLTNTFGTRTPFLNSPRFNLPDANNNPNLKPENKDTWEVGLEMRFLKNRFSFDITYYNEATNDLITPVEIDPSSGFVQTVLNAGNLSNKGIEILVNATPIQTENFSWDLTWNFSKNENELLDLVPGVETLELARFPFNGVTLNAVVGESYGVIRGTNFVFDEQGNKVLTNGRYVETKNVENLGSVLPDYNTGLQNSLTYKSWNLTFLIDHQKGGVYRSLTNIWGNYSGILEQTAVNNIREVGVVQPGMDGTVTFDSMGNYTVTNTSPNTTVISAQKQGADYFFRPDAANIFDADYFKLREVSLSYSVPKNIIDKTFFNGVKISAYGRNLFTWGLANDNFDPEIATNGSGNIQGSEGGSLPSSRTYGLNIQFKF